MSVATKKKKIFDGRYEILSIVGRGACSVVYHARHAMTQSSEVALKVLLNQKGGGSNTERLRKEALAMVSSRHKYVVRLDDFHSVKDLCYLAMEYAREGDLRKFSAKHGGKLSLQQAEIFFLQSAEALNFVHRVGITHRDIKPDNILVMNEREIRLADFGVAVLPGELASLEDLRAGVGTMSYMAPEVLEGKACDKLSDIYSLGVTFYEMLSGVHPFENLPLIKQLEGREDANLKPIHKLVPQIPRYLSETIMRCIRYEPTARFPSIAELLAALEKREMPTSAKERPQKEPPPTRPVSPRITSEVGPTRKAPTERREKDASVSQSAPEAEPFKVGGKRSSAAVNEKRFPLQKSLQAEPSAEDGFEIVPEPQIDTPPASSPLLSKPAKEERAMPIRSVEVVNDEESVVEFGDEFDPHAEPSAVEVESTIPVYDEPDFESVKQPDYRQHPKKSRLLSPPSRPAYRPSTRSGITFSLPQLKRLAYLAVLLIVGYLLFQRIAGFLGIGTSESDTLQTTSDAQLIPTVSAALENFPRLPNGIFAGTISSLVPGREVPLTIISSETEGTLTFLVGVNGWTPSVGSYRDDAARKKRGLQNNEIQIASNGFVLNFQGTVENDAVRGTFKNIINGESGSWSIRPLR